MRPDSLMAFMYGLVGLCVPAVAAISQTLGTTPGSRSVDFMEPIAPLL
jgi:hypothetical protein